MSRLSRLLKSTEFKKQRRDRKERRSSKTKQLENREGKQYESGLGFRKESPDAQGEISPPMTLAERRKIPSGSDFNRVVTDLETSSRGMFCQIQVCWFIYCMSNNISTCMWLHCCYSGVGCTIMYIEDLQIIIIWDPKCGILTSQSWVPTCCTVLSFNQGTCLSSQDPELI